MSDVEISIRIAASPSTVFRYFTDPERMREWMGVTVDIDPHPGGIYRVNVNGGGDAVGEYLEVVIDSRVVWTWGFEGNDALPPGASTVEVTLTPDGDETIVHLRHFGLPDGDAVDQHRRGWDHYGARLSLAASGVDPGPDGWVTLS